MTLLKQLLTERSRIIEQKETKNQDEKAKAFDVMIRHNYYAGKNYDNHGREFPVHANSAEEAEEIVRQNKDEIEKILRSIKIYGGRLLIMKSDTYKFKDKDIGRVRPTTRRYPVLAFDPKTKTMVKR